MTSRMKNSLMKYEIKVRHYLEKICDSFQPYEFISLRTTSLLLILLIFVLAMKNALFLHIILAEMKNSTQNGSKGETIG